MTFDGEYEQKKKNTQTNKQAERRKKQCTKIRKYPTQQLSPRAKMSHTFLIGSIAERPCCRPGVGWHMKRSHLMHRNSTRLTLFRGCSGLSLQMHSLVVRLRPVLSPLLSIRRCLAVSRCLYVLPRSRHPLGTTITSDRNRTTRYCEDTNMRAPPPPRRTDTPFPVCTLAFA